MSDKDTVRSIATMLGWVNVPPCSTLERDISALKRAATAPAKWAFEMLDMGFTIEQVGYMILAQGLVDRGEATSVDDVELRFGSGIVDKAVLRATLFPN